MRVFETRSSSRSASSSSWPVGTHRIVDEILHQFTHTVQMDWLLRGIALTHRRVDLAVVVVEFVGDKIVRERIYWDQASALLQVGALSATGLPITGAEQPAAVADPLSQPRNQLIRTMTVAASPTP